MANFTNKQINKTFQRLIQVDGAVIQDGLGNTLSGSMSDLTVNGTLSITGHTNVSESLTRLNTFSSSLNNTFATDAELSTVSSSLAIETAQLLEFSSSLNNDFATDTELSNVSSSLALETAQLLDFSSSLNNTFATDTEVSTAVSALNSATSSYALKVDVSGSFDNVSSSFASQITSLENFSSSLDNTFASDAELSTVSQSLATTIDNLEYSDVTALNAATSSYALKTQISGSFNNVSSSLAADITSLNVATASYALKTEISGSFNLASSSIDSTITANELARDSSVAALSSSIQLRVETNETSITELLNHSGSLTNIFAPVELEPRVDRIQNKTGSYVEASQTGSFATVKNFASNPVKDHLIPTIVSGSASDEIWITGSTYQNSTMLYLNYSGSNGDAEIYLPNCQFNYNTYRYIWVQADSTISSNKYFKLYASGSQTINGSTSPFIISSSYQTTRVWSDGKEWIKVIN